MLFQKRKLIMTACTVPTFLAVVGFSLGVAHASETALNTDTVNFQGQEYRYLPVEAFNRPVSRPRTAVNRTPVQAVRHPMAGNYNKPQYNNTPYSNTGYNNARPYPNNIRPYSARPPVNRPVPYGRPGPVAGPRPSGAPPLNPPFAGPGNQSTPSNSAIVIRDPDIPKEYANNPYINGSYTSKPPPPVNNPNTGRHGGGSGPFKNMGFGPFNGNDAPWETWPFGSKDSFWSRKEFPLKNQHPSDWFNPGDPKEGLAVMWDDLIAAPDDIGTMPGGWNIPSVRVPNPVDLEDQLEKASKELPDLIRVYE